MDLTETEMKITVCIPRTVPRRRLYAPSLSVCPSRILLSLHVSLKKIRSICCHICMGTFKL